MNDTKHVPTLCSLFDGIGGFPLAAVRQFPDERHGGGAAGYV